MKRLDKQVRKNRFDYTQLASVELANGKTAYIYQQWSNEQQEEKILLGHEVFIAKVQEKDIFVAASEYTIPAGEKFPADRDFGVTAWSTGANEAKAYERLEEIINQYGRANQAA